MSACGTAASCGWSACFWTTIRIRFVTSGRLNSFAANGPSWTARLDGYDAMCVTSDRQVLTTPGFARHRAA